MSSFIQRLIGLRSLQLPPVQDKPFAFWKVHNNMPLEAVGTQDNRGFSKTQLPIPVAGSRPTYPLNDPPMAKQLAFFKAATRVNDSSELSAHITAIQEEAYKRLPYPCIWNFSFLSGPVVNHPFYPNVRQVVQQRADHQQIFLDLGAFLGTDLRQIVYEGWNKDDVLGIDIVDDWFRLGCKLFKDSESPIPFFLGDIFKPSVFDPSDPNPVKPDRSRIILRDLKDLNPLKRRARFITANSFFHLFDEADQKQLARFCQLLLSEEPGSAIFGRHRGARVKGLQPWKDETKMFTHSPESWKHLWETVFYPTKIKVEVDLEDVSLDIMKRFFPKDDRHCFLRWSVTRI